MRSVWILNESNSGEFELNLDKTCMNNFNVGQKISHAHILTP
jgi:hypothetical protein